MVLCLILHGAVKSQNKKKLNEISVGRGSYKWVINFSSGLWRKHINCPTFILFSFLYRNFQVDVFNMFFLCKEKEKKGCVEDSSLHWRLNLHPLLLHTEPQVTVLLRSMPLANVCVCVMLAQSGGANPDLWIWDFSTRLMWSLSKGTAWQALWRASKLEATDFTKDGELMRATVQDYPRIFTQVMLGIGWCVSVAAVKSTGHLASVCTA